MMAHGIRFNEYIFTEPQALVNWMPPKYAGLLVLLTKDANWAPQPFQPLWFGEFGNNAQHLAATRLIQIPQTEHVFISVLSLPFSTTTQRCAIRDQLIWAYNPTLQTQHLASAPGELASKLSQLERKHEEQTTELRQLLAGLDTLFETRPERRRRIGFLPDPKPASSKPANSLY
jgi:hypothetical protein